MAEVATQWVVVGAHPTRIPGEWGRESNQPPGQNAKNHLCVSILTIGGVLRYRSTPPVCLSPFGRLVARGSVSRLEVVVSTSTTVTRV